MKIYIGADHRGFKLKEELKLWLINLGYEVVDMGAVVFDPNDDYPLVAEKLGKAVTNTSGSMGILLCGSGVGASAAVNKIDGIRAAIGFSANQVRAGRHDDDMNVLILPSDEIKFAGAKKLVGMFLATPYVKEKRYERRLDEIRKIEANHF
ncbi:RpiB/LacA/LacB family sugar-phosphate isomerase [Candidatus Collierbacteria bacterium]|nr:RpiB/LacA/LacB family sugar-phosphate isomerase [Candidatus Collierbacteria bacterium]